MGSFDYAVGGIIQTSKPPAVEPSLQPSGKDEALILVPATPIEYTQTAYLNADEWKGPLTMDQYLGREVHLQAQDLCKDGLITGWILTSPKLAVNEDGTRPILAACETIPTRAYVARNGKLENIIAHGIGSVFTRSEYRGKGYAGRMMMELGKQLETWQQKDGQKGAYSVLFSDIGQNFYSRFGWANFASTHIVLSPVTPEEYTKARQNLPEVEDLHTSDLADIPTVQYLEDELRAASEQRPDVPHVAIRPDHEHFVWHHAREEFHTYSLGLDFPTIKGTIHKPTGVALIWCRVYSAKPEDWQLHVLRTIIPPNQRNSPEAVEALSAVLLRAQLEAHSWQMTQGVEVWDPSDIVIEAAQKLRSREQGKVEVITRDKEHLNCLRWIGSDDNNVVWLANEKYAWC